LLFDKNACIMAVTTKKEKAQMLPASELPQPGVPQLHKIAFL
jgi:hypothetical protein